MNPIIPAQAGIQNVEFRKFFPDRFLCGQVWIPACAGMTTGGFKKGMDKAACAAGNEKAALVCAGSVF